MNIKFGGRNYILDDGVAGRFDGTFDDPKELRGEKPPTLHPPRNKEFFVGIPSLDNGRKAAKAILQHEASFLAAT